MQTIVKVVMDGEALTSLRLLEIEGTQEPSGSTIPNESVSSSWMTMPRELTTCRPIYFGNISIFSFLSNKEHLSLVNYRTVPLNILVLTAQE